MRWLWIVIPLIALLSLEVWFEVGRPQQREAVFPEEAGRPQKEAMAKAAGPTEGPAVGPQHDAKAQSLKRSLFADSEALDVLQETLISVQDHIDESDRSKLLQEAQVDTQENVDQALEVLEGPYESFERDSVRGKVLALHLLGVSKRLESESCLRLLGHLVDSYVAAPSERHRNAYLWDLLATAKICGRLDGPRAVSLYTGIQHPTAAEQVAIGLRAVGAL